VQRSGDHRAVAAKSGAPGDQSAGGRQVPFETGIAARKPDDRFGHPIGPARLEVEQRAVLVEQDGLDPIFPASRERMRLDRDNSCLWSV
jgi:hypothetical protein